VFERRKIQSILIVRMPWLIARRNLLDTLSDKNPAANVPARDIGAIKLNTVAARLGSRPLLVTTETMWKIRAVLIRECEDPARRRSQKLFVRIASAKEK
tara:strand:+ start:1875 stop:2171 length:297 start_codon:yes stop_codon:yes gene_type:complete